MLEPMPIEIDEIYLVVHKNTTNLFYVAPVKLSDLSLYITRLNRRLAKHAQCEFLQKAKNYPNTKTLEEMRKYIQNMTPNNKTIVIYS